jgi:hypothetical protein
VVLDMAVYQPLCNSLIAVSKNLSHDQYVPLCPEKYGANVSLLWNHFAEDVLISLMHMAYLYVITFADLQIGWDCTSKITICQHHDGFDLQLINFEILTTSFRFDAQSAAFHKSYGEREPEMYSALKFVWWQSVLVAHCWVSKTKSKSFSAEAIVQGLNEGPEGAMWTCFQPLHVSDRLKLYEIMGTSKVTISNITDTILVFGELFRCHKENTKTHTVIEYT